MRAGELRERITIQQATATRDAIGGEVEAWTTYAEMYAAIEPLSGRELFAAKQVAGEVSHRVRIRYHAGIVPKMRALHGARVLDIEAALNVDTRDRETHLYCREVL